MHVWVTMGRIFFSSWAPSSVVVKNSFLDASVLLWEPDFLWFSFAFFSSFTFFFSVSLLRKNKYFPNWLMIPKRHWSSGHTVDAVGFPRTHDCHYLGLHEFSAVVIEASAPVLCVCISADIVGLPSAESPYSFIFLAAQVPLTLCREF